MVEDQDETRAEPIQPAHIAGSYYDFKSYITKTRMLTFWHQLDEVLATEPNTVLEVGIGPQLVAGTLREFDIELTTVDINPVLRPDRLGSVERLDQLTERDEFDTVLCARVLHHLPFSEFERCVEQLARAATGRVIITLPVDDARLYFAFRRTAGDYQVRSIAFPLWLKSLAAKAITRGDARYRTLWKINSAPDTTESNLRSILNRHCRIDKWYQVPEDRSHAVIVLRPR